MPVNKNTFQSIAASKDTDGSFISSTVATEATSTESTSLNNSSDTSEFQDFELLYQLMEKAAPVHLKTSNSTQDTGEAGEVKKLIVEKHPSTPQATFSLQDSLEIDSPISSNPPDAAAVAAAETIIADEIKIEYISVPKNLLKIREKIRSRQQKHRRQLELGQHQNDEGEQQQKHIGKTNQKIRCSIRSMKNESIEIVESKDNLYNSYEDEFAVHKETGETVFERMKSRKALIHQFITRDTIYQHQRAKQQKIITMEELARLEKEKISEQVEHDFLIQVKMHEHERKKPKMKKKINREYQKYRPPALQFIYDQLALKASHRLRGFKN